MTHKIISAFIIFLSGIGLNLTPCVYPLIPITISYFGARSVNMKGKPYIHAFMYIIGIAITNSFLATIASVTGSMFGFILQNPFVIGGISAFLFILALSLFDIWEIKIPNSITRILSKQFAGYKGSLFIGLLFGIIAAPCAGPFILGLMIYVAKEADLTTSFIYFLSLSLGMGVPIGILATFSGMMNRLPLAGEWMIWIKRLLAWLLILMGVYVLRPIIGEYLQKLLMGLVVFTSGLHLGFLDKSAGKRLYFAKKIIGSFLILTSLYIPFLYHAQEIEWIPYSNSIMEEVKKKTKPIIMDFYADWCLSCVQMDKNIFHDPKIIAMSKKFIMIKVDLTHQTPYQETLLRRFNIRGLPAVVFISKKGTFKLEGEITKKEFTRKMKQIVSLSNI